MREEMEIQCQIIQESGQDPHDWIRENAEDFRKIINDMKREGYIPTKESVKLLLSARTLQIVRRHK